MNEELVAHSIWLPPEPAEMAGKVSVWLLFEHTAWAAGAVGAVGFALTVAVVFTELLTHPLELFLLRI